MRVLVTGGAGFIGSAVCRHFVAELGYTVLNVDKLTYAANLNSLRSIENNCRYQFQKIDICDKGAIGAAFANFAPDAVLHLAAESHVDRSIDGSDVFMQTNIMGTFGLLEAARTYWLSLDKRRAASFRFLHVSTDEVYGSLDSEGLFREETRYDPSSPYAASKAASDHLAIAWHRTYGLPVIVSNGSNTYGPYQFPEKLIALTILNARDGVAIPVYGDGKNVRDWLYVDDHARALGVILERGRAGEKYNVGGRNERDNLAVVRRICALMDRHRPLAAPHSKLIRFVADRPGHDRRYGIDATKLETELGWRAQDSFDTGIEKTVSWYLDNPAWWGPLRGNGAGGDAPEGALRVQKLAELTDQEG